MTFTVSIPMWAAYGVCAVFAITTTLSCVHLGLQIYIAHLKRKKLF